MQILALDLSTHAGYAVFSGEAGSKPALVESGTIDLDLPVPGFGPYPHNYRKAATYMAELIWAKTTVTGRTYRAWDVIVVEEINSGKNRYVQKLLENIHTAVQVVFSEKNPSAKFVYLNSDGADGWRTNLGLTMSKEQKKANAKLSKAKKEAAEIGRKVDKKSLGIKGKTTKKHLAVARANHEYDLKLIQKDNNTADAVCLGLAFCNGATPCDGVR